MQMKIVIVIQTVRANFRIKRVATSKLDYIYACDGSKCAMSKRTNDALSSVSNGPKSIEV